MANTQLSTRPSWWERFSERCYQNNIGQVAREMQHDSPMAYGELIRNLELPLESNFEREVARQLDQGAYAFFTSAETLLPVMMQRFGLDEASFAEGGELTALGKTCNACPMVGHCWRAMRRDADVAECRGFCPNTEAFDRQAALV